MNLADTAAGGPLLAALAVAALAGVVSFFAPCMLPLVPGYLSYVTGLAGSESDSPRRRRTLAGAGLFVAGFTVVFTLMAYAAGQLGRVLLLHMRTIEIVVGLATVLLGLGFAGLLPMSRTWRPGWLPRVGLAGAPLLGATFALSWTPCLGPTLTVVLGLAATQGSAGRGTVLAAAYSLGLGLPLLGVAAGMSWLGAAVAFIRRHNGWVTRAGGAMLVVIGVALTTGVWTTFVNWLRATVGPGQIGI
ncbi:cytochrome c biogenesis CcdA family protein [Catellatospora methionotrophica]|uniref:cytochrome c biogenesis CcdA family protein n=1 Tax=Catellatospora methionotrophica TaxID=121620 RepID=UPI0033DF8908